MKKSAKIYAIILVFLTSLLILATLWVRRDFPTLGFELILFNILSSKEGMDNTVLNVGLRNVFLYPLIITFAVALLAKYLHTHNKLQKLKFFHNFHIPLLLTMAFLTVLPISAGALGVFSYMKDISTYSGLYEEYYVDPSTVEFTFPEEPKNLIYIVLESMENSFSSTELGGTREENVIPNLTNLYFENINFSTGDSLHGFIPTVGATWTAGGLSAQLLGVPLILPVDADSDILDDFLPGAFGLGDILALEGYNQMAVLGSDSSFGNRRDLYVDHGITEILDYPEAKERGLIPQDYLSYWGYEDDKLFDYCKMELLRLAELDEPFFLTALTVDTHFEDGYPCVDCPSHFDDQYSNVISCSDTKIYEFITWIMAQDFYEDTIIVIAGDHLTMDRDYLADIDEDYVRTVYHTILGADESLVKIASTKNRTYGTVDLLPTTLASMGITWNGDRLALGTNLYSYTPTLLELLGEETLGDEIRATSTYYNSQILGIAE